MLSCDSRTAPSALYTRPTQRLSRTSSIQKLGAENHMLQLNVWCSWWWAYVPKTCRAKNTSIKIPCCIKLAFQIISWGRCTVKQPSCYYKVVSHVFIIFQRTLYVRKAGKRSIVTTDVRAYIHNTHDFSILHIRALENWIVTCRVDGIISHFLATFRASRSDAKLRRLCGLAYANMKFFLSKAWKRNKDKPSRILNLIYMKLSEKLYAPLALSPAQETRKHFTWLKRGPEVT